MAIFPFRRHNVINGFCNWYFRAVIYCFILMFLFSCSKKIQPVFSLKGSVHIRSRSLTSTKYTDIPILPQINFWYRDSVAIQEIRRTTISTIADSSKQNTSIKYPLFAYRFIDLRTNCFFDYSSFSDTASIIRRGKLSDTVTKNQGWCFWEKEPLGLIVSVAPLADTIMNNITYRRFSVASILNNNPYKSIAFFQCDTRITPMQLLSSFNNRINCPCARIDILPTPQDSRALSTQIEYLPGVLAPEEEKVFATWKKNAKGNPVQ